MDAFRQSRFKDRHGCDVPGLAPVAASQCLALLERLKQRLGVAAGTAPVDVMRILDGREEPVASIDAGPSSFRITDAFPTALAPMTS